MKLNLNLAQDAQAAAAWLLDALAEGSPSATTIAQTQGAVPAAESALEAGADELAETIAAEAIAKLPGGELALKIGGPLVDRVIEKLVAKGVSLVPGWTPAPVPIPKSGA